MKSNFDSSILSSSSFYNNLPYFPDAPDQTFNKYFEQLINGLLQQNTSPVKSTLPTAKPVAQSRVAKPEIKKSVGQKPSITVNQKAAAQSSRSLSLINQAYTYQINQFSAEKRIGGDGLNANCGPACLAMGLHALGLKVKGETARTIDGKAVDLARQSMVIDPSKDGVDENGRRVEKEHSTYTDFDELTRGAKAAGAKPDLVTPNAANILQAIKKGAKVIVSGDFSGKNPLPWTGDSRVDNQISPGGATQHFVLVTGYDNTNNRFIINDPARTAPLSVNAQKLEYFMQGNEGALAIYPTK